MKKSVKKKSDNKKVNTSELKHFIVPIAMMLISVIIFLHIPSSFVSGMILIISTCVACLSLSVVFCIQHLLDKNLTKRIKISLVITYVVWFLIMFETFSTVVTVFKNYMAIADNQKNEAVCRNKEVVKNCVKNEEKYTVCKYVIDEETSYSLTCDNEYLSSEQYREE